MRILMILPALTEATSPLFRPVKYSLFPPLGLATLAGYLPDGDAVRIVDEHVERFAPDDAELPDLVVIQVYVTSARRSYELADWYRARGVFVALGGLHVTSLPDEAARHADAIFCGPGARGRRTHRKIARMATSAARAEPDQRPSHLRSSEQLSVGESAR